MSGAVRKTISMEKTVEDEVEKIEEQIAEFHAEFDKGNEQTWLLCKNRQLINERFDLIQFLETPGPFNKSSITSHSTPKAGGGRSEARKRFFTNQALDILKPALEKEEFPIMPSVASLIREKKITNVCSPLKGNLENIMLQSTKNERIFDLSLTKPMTSYKSIIPNCKRDMLEDSDIIGNRSLLMNEPMPSFNETYGSINVSEIEQENIDKSLEERKINSKTFTRPKKNSIKQKSRLGNKFTNENVNLIDQLTQRYSADYVNVQESDLDSPIDPFPPTSEYLPSQTPLAAGEPNPCKIPSDVVFEEQKGNSTWNAGKNIPTSSPKSSALTQNNNNLNSISNLNDTYSMEHNNLMDVSFHSSSFQCLDLSMGSSILSIESHSAIPDNELYSTCQEEALDATFEINKSEEVAAASDDATVALNSTFEVIEKVTAPSKDTTMPAVDLLFSNEITFLTETSPKELISSNKSSEKLITLAGDKVTAPPEDTTKSAPTQDTTMPAPIKEATMPADLSFSKETSPKGVLSSTKFSENLVEDNTPLGDDKVTTPSKDTTMPARIKEATMPADLSFSKESSPKGVLSSTKFSENVLSLIDDKATTPSKDTTMPAEDLFSKEIPFSKETSPKGPVSSTKSPENLKSLIAVNSESKRRPVIPVSGKPSLLKLRARTLQKEFEHQENKFGVQQPFGEQSSSTDKCAGGSSNPMRKVFSEESLTRRLLPPKVFYHGSTTNLTGNSQHLGQSTDNLERATENVMPAPQASTQTKFQSRIRPPSKIPKTASKIPGPGFRRPKPN